MTVLFFSLLFLVKKKRAVKIEAACHRPLRGFVVASLLVRHVNFSWSAPAILFPVSAAALQPETNPSHFPCTISRTIDSATLVLLPFLSGCVFEAVLNLFACLFFSITYISAGLLKYFVCEVQDGVWSACYCLWVPTAVRQALLF